MANKASLIRRSLRIDPLAAELCRRERVEHHLYAWLVEIDGIIDVRTLPLALQEEARRRGLLPSRSPSSPRWVHHAPSRTPVHHRLPEGWGQLPFTVPQRHGALPYHWQGEPSRAGESGCPQ